MLADLRSRLESPLALRLGIGLYALVLALGLKRFVVWDQIMVLEDAGLADTLLSGHPHTLRWLVMQPALAFARLGYDPDPVFTVVGFACVVGAALLLARVAGNAVEAVEVRLRLPILLALACLSLAMNGRLLPAFFGLALILAVARSGLRPGWLIAGQLTGLLYASVSSGTFAVAGVVCAGTWLGLLAGAGPWVRRGAVVLGLGVAGIIAALGMKALRHFGGDPLAMLGHGPGVYLGHLPPLGAVGAVLALVAVLGAFVALLPAEGRMLRFALAATLVIGLFGWATLAMAAVPLVALGAAMLLPPTSRTGRPAVS